MRDFILFIYLSITLIIFLSTCSNASNRSYGYYSTEKEWEIQLDLNEDYTFVIEDKHGCNQLRQHGVWKLLDKNKDTITILLEDNNIKPQKGKNLHGKYVVSYSDDQTNIYYQNPIENQFPLITSDTVYINSKELRFKDFVFIEGLKDLQNKRILEIESDYIEDIGEDQYILLFGDGLSKEKARENLKKCGIF